MGRVISGRRGEGVAPPPIKFNMTFIYLKMGQGIKHGPSGQREEGGGGVTPLAVGTGGGYGNGHPLARVARSGGHR